MLNAGHQRGKPAIRCVGPLQIPTKFDVFAMAALAGIGTMPDTIVDRAVNITMRRRSVWNNEIAYLTAVPAGTGTNGTTRPQTFGTLVGIQVPPRRPDPPQSA